MYVDLKTQKKHILQHSSPLYAIYEFSDKYLKNVSCFMLILLKLFYFFLNDY